MIIVNLKSDTSYEFNNIKHVKIKREMLTIRGNFKKRGKYSSIKLYKKMIDEKSLEMLMGYLYEYFKEYTYEGLCPECNSSKISEIEMRKIKRRMNRTKEESKILQKITLRYECNLCKHEFEDPKETDTILYWR